MKYTKPALSFEQQADQLLNRGFQADRARLIETLSRVSYYRLSAYWHPFKQPTYKVLQRIRHTLQLCIEAQTKPEVA